MRTGFLVALVAFAFATVGVTVAAAEEDGEVTICFDGTMEITFVPDDTGLAVIEQGGFWTDADGNFYLDSGSYEGDPNDLTFVSITLGPCADPEPEPEPEGSTATSTASTASPPSPPRLFLCYSSPWQTVPGVWGFDAAQRLIRDGYWEPFAVAGPMAGGVNTTNGRYHLDCNADDKGLKGTGVYVDNNGSLIPEAYEDVYASLAGVYEVYG